MDIRPEARSRRSVAGALALPALLLAGCGPTDQEIGVAILTSLVLIVPLAAALNYGLHRLWRDTRKLSPASGGEAAAASLVTLALVVALNVLVLPADAELVLIAWWLIGTTYLTFFSLAIGAALALSRPWAFRVLYWLPAVMIAPAALPMALEVHLEAGVMDTIMLVLLWSGGLGAVGGTLFVVLLGVSIYVFVRHRRRPPDPEPPLTF